MRFIKRRAPRTRADGLRAGDRLIAEVVLVERTGSERDVRVVFKFGEFGPLEVAVLVPYLKVRTQ